ncbi:TPA: hypothetical protein L4G80_006007 [Pseudomonas aeruginosa]|nr:hypothetical protein [Pseudomonas aeruginosa]HBO2172129.1 hypothetical protein [Pseudomonas aeruginosa]HBP1486276.1 hypothetical protein [Pseudomonas aeruginosa]
MMKHTPGPWYRDGTTVYALNPHNFNRFSAQIHGAHTPKSELEAVAQLMQAAPELLEACQAFKRLYGRLLDVVEPSGSGFLSPESVKEYDAIHELMTAAIAKATA